MWKWKKRYKIDKAIGIRIWPTFHPNLGREPTELDKMTALWLAIKSLDNAAKKFVFILHPDAKDNIAVEIGIGDELLMRVYVNKGPEENEHE